MSSAGRVTIVVPLLMGAMLLAGVPAFAQVDFTGVWNPRLGDEDNPERLAGPSLVEFLGLPVNDYALGMGAGLSSGAPFASRASVSGPCCPLHPPRTHGHEDLGRTGAGDPCSDRDP